MFDGLWIRFDVCFDVNVNLDDVQRYVVEVVSWVLQLRRDVCTDVCHGSLERMLIVSILLSCQSERPT